jgi:hypothetical protein
VTGDEKMAAWRATDDSLTLHRVNDDGVDEADIVPRLRAEMERVDGYIIDMKDRILPLWSSPHDLLPEVAALLQQWHARQADMRGFFASPTFVEVQALRKKYVKQERMVDAVCELMDLKRWINSTENMICTRTANQIVCMYKQRTLQQLVTEVSREAGDDVQSSVDRLLNKTSAKLAVQQRCAQTRVDRLALTDEARAQVASIDWTNETHQQLYEARWSQLRSNVNALLVLVCIRRAVSWYDKLQKTVRDAEMPRTE